MQLPECEKWQFEWLISSLIWYISKFWRRRRDAHKLTFKCTHSHSHCTLSVCESHFQINSFFYPPVKCILFQSLYNSPYPSLSFPFWFPPSLTPSPPLPSPLIHPPTLSRPIIHNIRFGLCENDKCCFFHLDTETQTGNRSYSREQRLQTTDRHWQNIGEIRWTIIGWNYKLVIE